jgi:hypothetical protein
MLTMLIVFLISGTLLVAHNVVLIQQRNILVLVRGLFNVKIHSAHYSILTTRLPVEMFAQGTSALLFVLSINLLLDTPCYLVVSIHHVRLAVYLLLLRQVVKIAYTVPEVYHVLLVM